MFWNRQKVPYESKVYTKSRARMETVPSDEILRYMDNLHTHLGQLLTDTRKSLARDLPNEADDLLCDVIDSTHAIHAGADVLRSRKE
jgi:hypothetical protein